VERAVAEAARSDVAAWREWPVAPTAAWISRSSVTASPSTVLTTEPRDMTTTRSHRPSSSLASDDATTTGTPPADTSRRMR